MNSQLSKTDQRREKIIKEYNILVFDNTKVKEAAYSTLNRIDKKEYGSFTFGQKKESFYRETTFFANLMETKLIRHPLILALYGVIENDETLNYDYAIEIVKGTSISEQIKYQTNTEIEQIMIALDLCKVITYLHENGFVHQQIFPKNTLIDLKKDFRLLVDFAVLSKAPNDIIKTNLADLKQKYVKKEFDIWALGNFLNELFSGGDKLWINVGSENTKTLSLLYEQYPYTVSSKIKNPQIRKIIETCAQVKAGSNYNISSVTIDLYKEFFSTAKNSRLGSLFSHYTERERFFILCKIRSYLVLHKFYLNIKQKKVKDFNFLTVFMIKQDKFIRRMSKTMSVLSTVKMSIDELISRPITKDNVRKFISKLKLSVIQSEKVSDKKETIGEGGYATVRKAVFNGLEIALKKLNVFNLEKFTKEIIIIKKYNHPNIPLLYGLIQRNKDQNITFEIAFEFIKGDTLDIFLSRNTVTEIEKFLILLDLAQVIEYLHAFNLIHRDLKPQNIMINEKKEVKLFDFGISKITKNAETKTREGTGTCFYMVIKLL